MQLLPYSFASDLAIIQNSLIGSNVGNRSHCKVCADGAQSMYVCMYFIWSNPYKVTNREIKKNKVKQVIQDSNRG